MEKRKCTKIAYVKKDRAWKMAAKFFARYGIPHYAYKCSFCTLYHLTTHPRKGTLRSLILPKAFIDQFNKWYGSDIL